MDELAQAKARPCKREIMIRHAERNYLQAAYREFVRPGRTKEASVLMDSVPLLELPDGILAEIASQLPPAGLAILQTTCKHLNSLLMHNRFVTSRA